MRKTFGALLLGSVFWLFVFAGCGGGGGEQSGLVTGHIYIDGDSLTNTVTATPAEGAMVSTSSTRASTLVLPDGSFSLPAPAGDQRLVVSLAGYSSIAFDLTIPAGGQTTTDGLTPIPLSYKWVVLVYMIADNNLYTFSQLNMNQMEAAPNSEDVAVVVQWERLNDPNVKRYLIKHDTNTSTIGSQVLEEIGNVNMSDPQVVNSFIDWTKARFPAEQYAFIFWDHGDGWRNRTRTVVSRAIANLSTVDFPQALADSTPFDVVAFDACLMQMVEVGYQIRNNARYVVASEELEDATGYNYTGWLTQLVNTPTMTPLQFGTAIASQTFTMYNDYYGGSTDQTQSVVETAQLSALATAIGTFEQALYAVRETEASALAAARDATESYWFYGSGYVDLYDYALQMKTQSQTAAVDNAADGVMAAVTAAVKANYHGTLSPAAHGISIYAPSPAIFTNDATAYNLLSFAQFTNWGQWLLGQQQ
ncbi:MAG: clostripain-related cysteine peptidase [Armatimonadota bacterium]